MLGRFCGLHERHIDVVERLHRLGSGASLGDVTVELTSHNPLGGPDTINQLVDVHSGGEAHVFHHVEQVFSGGHTGGTAVAAVRATAKSADGAIQFQCVIRA